MSGMRRSEFCRTHGLELNALIRYLKKHRDRQRPAGSDGVEQSRLVAVELADPVSTVPTCVGTDPQERGCVHPFDQFTFFHNVSIRASSLGATS